MVTTPQKVVSAQEHNIRLCVFPLRLCVTQRERWASFVSRRSGREVLWVMGSVTTRTSFTENHATTFLPVCFDRSREHEAAGRGLHLRSYE